MKLSPADQRTYPKVTEYVKKRIPRLATNGSILKNLKKFGSLTMAEGRSAVRWGSGPLIVIKSLSNWQCGVQAAYGCFVSTRPNQIELGIQFAQDFENDASGVGSDSIRGGKKSVYVLGATLLHELCHWGNHKHGVPEATEQGAAFETATYGQIVY